MTQRAIWIDPGENVGWATFEATRDPKLEHGVALKVVDYGNNRLRTFATKLLKSADKYDVIGFETYTIRPDKLRIHAGSTVPTLQLVGMIRLAAWAAQERRGDGFPLIDEQDTGHKKRGLGAMRLWLPEYVEVAEEALAGPHDDGHFGDALMHGAAWFHREFYEKR